MKKINKYLTVIISIALLLICFFGISGQNSSNDDKNVTVNSKTTVTQTFEKIKYKIGVIKYEDSDFANEIYDAFFTQLNSMGLSKDENLTLMIENGYSDYKTCQSIAKTFVNNDFDLIFTIGKESTKAAFSQTKDIPIVFAGVSDPEGEGFVKSNQKPNSNVTGVSSYTPCFEQINLIKELIPDAKKIGIIYTQNNQNSLVQLNLVKSQSQKNGLEYKAYPISKSSDVKNVIETMADETDVFYLPDDKIVKEELSVIKKTALSKKIPTISATKSMVENGCLATYEIRNSSLGTTAAVMATDIVINNKYTEEMVVKYVTECNLVINENIMTQLNISLPYPLNQMAELIKN